MGRAWLLAGLVMFLLVLVGCLGDTDTAGRDAAGAERVAVDRPSAPASDRDASSSSEESDEEGDDTCDGVRENVTALLEAKREDPFGDRAPLEPQLVGCGDEGVFLLAAHGLEGPAAIELAWSLPEPATCQTFDAAGATGGHHRFHVEGWDHAEADPTVSFGTGGGAREVHAGPLDSTELLTEGDGRTAWAGRGELDLAAGDHSFVQATNGWGAWDSELTEGAALLHILVCDGSFSFEGIRTASTLHLFSHHDMQRGAGAGGDLFTGASAGQALDIELGERARLRVGGFALGGAGAMQIADADSEDRYTFGPEAGLRLVQDVPEGPLTITQARGGSVVVIAGAVYVDMSPIAPDAVLGGS